MAKIFLAGGVLGFWLFAFSSFVFAGPVITIFSSPDTLTASQSFFLSATASGLVAGGSYYVKARVGSVSAAMNKGETFNSLNDSPDDWLSDTDDWTKFPAVTAGVNGLWTGSVTARPTDGAFVGQNYLTLRLRSASGTNYDSASVSATVLAAPPPPPAEPSVPTVFPVLEINSPLAAILGETFKISAKLANFAAGQEYVFKIRAGPTETQLTRAQTQNGPAFLSDNESWTSFPRVRTDDKGSASFDALGRVEEDKDEGIYKIRLRLRKKDSETSYDSTLAEIKMTSPPVASAPAKTVSPATVEAQTNLVLGTESGEILESTPETLVASQASSSKAKSHFPLLPGLLVFLGLVAGVVPVAFLLRRRFGV